MIMEKIKSMSEIIDELLDLADENLIKNTFSRHPDVLNIYLKEIRGEMDEAEEEIKKDNFVYLEDELGDIFWDYLMLLKILERDEYIRSVNHVFSRSVDKFKERYKVLFGVDKDNPDSEIREKLWKEVKKKQKQNLKDRHNKLYN